MILGKVQALPAFRADSQSHCNCAQLNVFYCETSIVRLRVRSLEACFLFVQAPSLSIPQNKLDVVCIQACLDCLDWIFWMVG